MMTSEAIKVFPKVSELNKILNHLECPEKDCTEVFKNGPNLTLHLLKTHGKEKSLKSSAYGCKIAQYYCPEVGCKYYFNPNVDDTADSNKLNNRYFTQFKYLKQHYIKVHLDKTYVCDKCNKGFPTELHRLRHYEICGNKYTCSCGAEYSFLASLQTHARREQHSYNVDNLKGPSNRSRKSSLLVAEQRINNINNNINNNKKNNNNNNEYNMEVICQNFQNKTINSLTTGSLLVFPKGTNILVLHNTAELEQNLIKDNLNTTSVATQTDIIPKRRKTLSPVKGVSEKPLKKRTSAQTQTGEKRPKKTTETQTSFQLNVLSFEDKNKDTRNIQGGRKRKKSMETQTQDNIIVRHCNYISVDKEISTSENYLYSGSELVVSRISSNKKDDENYSLSSNIGQQDICLPQFWFNSEDENISKKQNKDDSCSVYLSNINNCSDKTPELVSPLSFDSVKKTDDISLSFYNQPDFNKRSVKESSSCHIETQTDSAINRLIDDYLNNCEKGIPEDDLLDQYTRWTQTCDDIILPDDIALDFTNNETQTAWSLSDDSFISEVVNSETQTPMLNIEDYILKNQ